MLLIDKPMGVTSHDVVDCIRRRFRFRRVGHGGTLDPLATGLLILLLGPSTRRANSFLGADKTYEGTLRLGIATDTQDLQGRVLQTREVGSPTPSEIEAAFARFRGEIEQVVPAYSAVRIGGRGSYDLARPGDPTPPPLRRVTIHELKILGVRLPEVDFSIACSKGTYVRAFCADIGEVLGCGAVLSRLHRTRIGSYSVEQAVKPDEATPGHILPYGP